MDYKLSHDVEWLVWFRLEAFQQDCKGIDHVAKLGQVGLCTMLIALLPELIALSLELLMISKGSCALKLCLEVLLATTRSFLPECSSETGGIIDLRATNPA